MNYDLNFTISDVSKIFKIDERTIQTCSYHFKDYLSKNANPEKGIKRVFITSDICTLNYILYYWEDNPDFESIKYGLNSNEQFEEPFSNVITEITPIFREFDDNDINTNIWLIGGEFDNINLFELGEAYKNAGDILSELIQKQEQPDVVSIYPIIYNYRHATELLIKSVLPEFREIHKLLILYENLKSYLLNEFNYTPSIWVENLITAFNDFDPKGTTFRYGVKINNDEMVVDFNHIKTLMNSFYQLISSIKKAHNY